MRQNLRRLLKKIYKFLFKPFFKNGININIGGSGNFRFDYIFLFSKFNTFGTKHNSGFKKWLDFCRAKNTVFDIGAHIGLYSIPASFVIKRDAIIYAFEPSSINRSYLKKHIRLNKINNIKVIPYMVGESSLDKVIFYENREVNAMSSVIIRKDFKSYRKTFKKQISLDDFCSINNVTPDIIKVDVEGYEWMVLKGARNILGKYRPILFLSLHPRLLSIGGFSLEDLMQYIAELGYVVYNSSGDKARDFKHNEYILVHEDKSTDEIF